MRFFISIYLILFVGCQPTPKTKSSIPMASQTSNETLQEQIRAIQTRMQDQPTMLRDMAIAEHYFNERRFIEASKLFSAILDQNSSLHRVRNLLARCFYFLGNPQRGLVELQYVIGQKPKDPEELLDALFLMGAIALETPSLPTKDVKKGIAAFETYLKLVPNGPQQTRIQDGLAKLRKREKEGPKIAKSEPTAPKNGLKHQGLEAFSKGDLALAEQFLKQALKAAPSDPEIGTTLARIDVQSGRSQDALKKFGEIVKAHSNHVPAWHYMGMAHMMQGDPSGAIKAWEQVIKHDAAYAEKFKLKDRIAVAKQMQGGGKP